MISRLWDKRVAFQRFWKTISRPSPPAEAPPFCSTRIMFTYLFHKKSREDGSGLGLRKGRQSRRNIRTEERKKTDHFQVPLRRLIVCCFYAKQSHQEVRKVSLLGDAAVGSVAQQLGDLPRVSFFCFIPRTWLILVAAHVAPEFRRVGRVQKQSLKKRTRVSCTSVMAATTKAALVPLFIANRQVIYSLQRKFFKTFRDSVCVA